MNERRYFSLVALLKEEVGNIICWHTLHCLFQEVSLVDAGTYTCTASNEQGSDSATGVLVVRREYSTYSFLSLSLSVCLSLSYHLFPSFISSLAPSPSVFLFFLSFFSLLSFSVSRHCGVCLLPIILGQTLFNVMSLRTKLGSGTP